MVDGTLVEDAVGNVYRYMKGFWLVNGTVAALPPTMPIRELVPSGPD